MSFKKNQAIIKMFKKLVMKSKKKLKVNIDLFLFLKKIKLNFIETDKILRGISRKMTM